METPGTMGYMSPRSRTDHLRGKGKLSTVCSYSTVALVAMIGASAPISTECFVPSRLSASRTFRAPARKHRPSLHMVLEKTPVQYSNSTTFSNPAFSDLSNSYASSSVLTPQNNQFVGDRYKAITVHSVDKVAERHPRLLPHLEDIKLSALIFPFKASPYLVDELIDWGRSGDIRQDPFYKLVFPTMDMLEPEHSMLLREAHAKGDPSNLIKVVASIREDLNPHPAGQKTLNTPKETKTAHGELTGIQHKYSETVLVFPAAAQTCHAYCTYCFRWAQFIGDDELRFAQKEADALWDYLGEHTEVSDILMTGGDPMIMKTKSLAQYLEPLTDPDFLPHIKNIRIGTRTLTFWPQRFLTDPDAEELLDLLRRVRMEGGRHFALMAHLGHERELSTEKVRHAIRRIQMEAMATIRSQAPIMRGINDSAEIWANKWRTEVQLGIIPYYMFMARDTGAQHYFDVPLDEAQQLYSDALRNCSGLIRTVRGPSMSCTPGKVEVTGVTDIMGEKAYVLRFLQCRDEAWIGKPFFAKHDPKAVWFDDLEPLDGMQLPWDENGLPRPIDE